MAHAYDSYLLRCWHLKNGSTRFAVEHVQSGERGVVASLQAATAWIGARSGGGTVPAAEDCPVSDARRADSDAVRPASDPPLSPTLQRLSARGDEP